VLRGEIWLVEFDAPVAAGEPAKTRPALVVSADRFNRTRAPNVIVVPLTTAVREHPLHAEIDAPGLAGVSYAQTELVGVMSRRRLIHRLGVVDQLVMAQVSTLITTLLDL
jgi:mRNA interferase MazF